MRIFIILIVISCMTFALNERSGLVISAPSFEPCLKRSFNSFNGEAYIHRLARTNYPAGVKMDGGNWTFMVYLDGDNNLEEDCINIFLDLSSVGSTPNVTIVVQLDRTAGSGSGYDNRFGDWTDCKRFKVTKGMTPTPGNATLDLGEVNMGHPNTLTNFVNWTINSYPADKYCLVLSDHGSGCVQSVCFDETSSNDALSLPELSQALSAVSEKMDVVYFDACLMGMVEVAYQIRDYADVMVASEEVAWTGTPYDYYLSNLTANPSMSASELANVIVSSYIEFTSDNSLTSTMSGVDLSQMSTLRTAVNNFAQTLNNSESLYNDEIRKARGQAEGYEGPYSNVKYGWYMDLYHFAQLIYQHIDNSTIRNDANQVMTSVSTVAIVEGHYDHPNSHGLSIFFPCQTENYYNTFMTAYSNTDFAEDTMWDAFIDYHASITPKKPDFVVVDVYWEPSSPVPGDAVTFYADLANQGTQDKSAYVRAYKDGSPYGSGTLDFPAGALREIYVDSPWTASLGRHNITWTMDPYGSVEEWNETNNEMTKTFTIGYSFTIQTPYSDLAVKIDGYYYATRSDGSYQKYVSPGLHSIEVPASVSSGSGSRGAFVQWNDGNSSNTRDIFVDSDLTMTADYVTQYYLTVNKNPSYIGETTGQDWYNNGTVANATCTSPVPWYSYRYVFANWTGDVFGNSTTLQILMDSPKTVTANYKAQYNVTFTTYGCDGSSHIIVDDLNYTLPCSLWLDSGTSHTFSYESPVSGSIGVQYVLTSTSRSSPFTATYSTTITGYYKTQFYITVNSAHGAPTPSQWLDKYSSLSVNVQPMDTIPNQTRWICTGFSVDHAPSQTGTGYTFYSIQEPHEIEFYWKQQFWLQINTNPTGLTQPTVSLGGPWYDNGTSVTCTAQRMNGYGFDHWTVDGTSRGSGVNPIMVIMDAPHEVIAHYFTDDVEPSIGVPIHQPDPPNQGENVTVFVNVNDGGSGVGEVFLYYKADSEGGWTEVNMSKFDEDTYVCEIPSFEAETHVQYYIIAYDNAYNQAVQDKNGAYYDYIVVPEFQEFLILLLFMLLTLIAVVLSKRIRYKEKMNAKS